MTFIQRNSFLLMKLGKISRWELWVVFWGTSIIFMIGCKSTGEPEKKPVVKSFSDISREKLFTMPPMEEEVFQVFITSDEFTVNQVSAKDAIEFLNDEKGNHAFLKVIEKYNKIEYFAHGVVMLELYPGNGRLKRIRFINPSGVGEIDKLISEDATRWTYKFPKGFVDPLRFNVRYGVALRKEISRDEAIQELKKYTR